MKSRYCNLLIALPILLGLTASARADIVVIQQHNYISIGDAHVGASEYSDSLTSWQGSLGSIGSGKYGGGESAALTSTIATDSVTLNSSTEAKALLGDNGFGGYEY